MQTISKRDLAWIAVSLLASGAASAALVGAVSTAPQRTILDLDWYVILGCAGAAMFGGVVGTLWTVHQAGEAGRAINVPMQLMLDLCRAVLLALAIYGAFAHYRWEPEMLPATLAIAGMLGQKILDPLGKALTTFATALANRVTGGPRDGT